MAFKNRSSSLKPAVLLVQLIFLSIQPCVCLLLFIKFLSLLTTSKNNIVQAIANFGISFKDVHLTAKWDGTMLYEAKRIRCSVHYTLDQPPYCLVRYVLFIIMLITALSMECTKKLAYKIQNVQTYYLAVLFSKPWGATARQSR